MAEVGWFLDTGHDSAELVAGLFLAGTEAPPVRDASTGPTFWSADLQSRAGLCARREVYW